MNVNDTLQVANPALMYNFSNTIALLARVIHGMVDDQSDLITTFYEALRALPSIEVVMLNDASGAGIEMQTGRRRYRTVVITSGAIVLELVPIIRREVFPRDARMILWDLQQIRKTIGQNQASQVPIVIAQGISAGARSLLREAGTSYYDLTGSIYLLSQGLYLFVDKPAPKRLVKLSQALFTGLRHRIIHCLLEHPDTWFSVTDLACRSGASTATTSQTLLLLEKHDWVETSGRGPTKRRRLLNPGSLADAWAEARRLERRTTAQRYSVPTSLLGKPLAVTVAEHCVRNARIYAFTDLIAGQLHLGRALTAIRVTCYLAVNESSDDLCRELGGVRDDSGNLIVIPMPNDPSWMESVIVENFRIVDPIESYIDLMADMETALAAEIRETFLGF